MVFSLSFSFSLSLSLKRTPGVASYHGSTSGIDSTLSLFLSHSLTLTSVAASYCCRVTCKRSSLSFSLSLFLSLMHTHTYTQTPGATLHHFSAVVNIIFSPSLSLSHTHTHTPDGASYRTSASCKDSTLPITNAKLELLQPIPSSTPRMQCVCSPIRRKVSGIICV